MITLSLVYRDVGGICRDDCRRFVGLRQVYEMMDTGIRVDRCKAVIAWNLSIEKVVQTPSDEALRGVSPLILDKSPFPLLIIL